MTKPNQTSTSPDESYEIRIRGYLDQTWSDRLGGMMIIPTENESGVTITTLIGRLPDQAALFGVLIALYDMRLPVLSFKCLQAD